MKQIFTTSLMLISLFSSFTLFAQNWLTKPLTPYLGTNARADLLAVPQQGIIWSTLADTLNYGGKSNMVARSIDNGNTWTNVNITNAVGNQRPSALFAINQDIAFVGMADFSNLGGGIYRTTDGGASWTRAIGAFDDPASFVDVVAFFDAQNGVALGDPLNGRFEVYTTADGGNTWTGIPVNDRPAAIANDEYGSFQCYGVVGNTIWVGTSLSRILKSTDKGLTWTAITTPNTSSGWMYSMAIKNDNEMWVSVDANATATEGTMKTTDGGTTWSWISNVGTAIQGVRGASLGFVKGSNDAYMLGGSKAMPGILLTTDGAATFTKIDNFGTSSDLVWLNPQTGYAHSNFSTGTLQPSLMVWNNGTVANDKPLVYENLQTYPNPATNVVTFETHLVKHVPVTLTMTDVMGKVVHQVSYENYTGKLIQTFYMNALPSGVYMIRAQLGDNIIVEKIVKE